MKFSILTLFITLSVVVCESELISLIKKRSPLTEVQKYVNTTQGKSEIESETWYYRKTPLILASETGKNEVVKLLLESRAQITARDRFGADSLMLASKFGDLSVVLTLLKHGANKYSTNTLSGYTAMTYAAKYCRIPVLQIYVEDDAGYSAEQIYQAMRLAHNEKCYKGVKYLLGHLNQVINYYRKSVKAREAYGRSHYSIHHHY